MAYTDFPLVVRGDLWTAAQHNTYFRDNFAASEAAIVTTKGDTLIGTGSKAIDRLAITAGRLMKSDASAPTWYAPGNPLEILRTNATADDYGWLAMPYGAIATRSANLTIAGKTETAVTFTAADFNDYSCWSAGAPTRITISSSIPATWVYLIQATTTINANLGADIVQINFRITRAGSSLGIGNGMTILGNNSVVPKCISFSAIRTLVPGDYIELIAYTQDNANHILSNTTFSVLAHI